MKMLIGQQAPKGTARISGLIVILSLLGCEGVGYNSSYKGPDGKVTGDMVSYKEKSMDFQLPPGWSPSPDMREVPNGIDSTSGIAVFRKGDRGELMVWFEGLRQNARGIETCINKRWPDIKNITPKALQVKAESGSNPLFLKYEGFRVVKGEPVGFVLLWGHKYPPMTSMSKRMYYVIAVSTSEAYSTEIEGDFIAVLRTLRY